MELRQIETFRAVAEERSFSRAAAMLGYVQSSVSAQVAALEHDLGVPLFDRLGRTIALTDAGRVMLRYSVRLLDLAEETRGAVAHAAVDDDEVTGTLTVSAPETLLTYRLPKVLALFHLRHPKVRLSVRPSAVGRLLGSMRRSIEDGSVDVAFVMDGRMEVSGVSGERLLDEAVSVIAPAGHALASSTRVASRDLVGETVLLPEAPESGCAYRGQFERQLAAAGVIPAEILEFQSIEAVKQCVGAGMGLAVLPTVSVQTELADGKLAALAWSEPFAVCTQMVWNGGRWESPALRAFLATARDVFPPPTDPNT